MQCSDRYGGARPFRHWWTVTASLKRTRSGTSSQCSWSFSIWPRPRSNFRVPAITRACPVPLAQNCAIYRTMATNETLIGNPMLEVERGHIVSLPSGRYIFGNKTTLSVLSLHCIYVGLLINILNTCGCYDTNAFAKSRELWTPWYEVKL